MFTQYNNALITKENDAKNVTKCKICAEINIVLISAKTMIRLSLVEFIGGGDVGRLGTDNTVVLLSLPATHTHPYKVETRHIARGYTQTCLLYTSRCV